jgi:hypothetical protein
VSKKYIKCKNSGPVPIPGTKNFLLDGMIVEGDYWASLVAIGFVEELKESAEQSLHTDGGIIVGVQAHTDGGIIISKEIKADGGVIIMKDGAATQTVENKKESKKAKGDQKKEKSSDKSLKNDKIDSSVSKPEPQESLNVVDDGKTSSGLD